MKSLLPFLYVLLISLAVICSCEEEKTEYKRFLDDDDWFEGFGGGCFTIHEQSIGYFYPDSGKVFPDIYRHQNGFETGKGIHSFIPGYYDNDGVMSIEDENRIEFFDSKNLQSKGSLELNHPRDIFNLYQNMLISYGNRPMSGIAIVNVMHQTVEKSLQIDIEAGKIYWHNNFFYVFSQGVDERDSSIIILQTDDVNDPSRFHITENVAVGSRPVDYEEINLDFDYYHKGMVILCLGDEHTPASLVIFDLITQKVIEKYHFTDKDFKPENLFWIGGRYASKRVLASCANGKVYQLQFTEPITVNVLINKNLSEFFLRNGRYYSVSKDTLSDHSQLYTIDAESFEIIDSTTIEPRAKFVIGRNY